MDRTPQKKSLVFCAVFVLTCVLCVTQLPFKLSLQPSFDPSEVVGSPPDGWSWRPPPRSAEENRFLSELLSQHFFYLGKGAQCYAFESQDHRWVMKLVKFTHTRPSMILRLLPPLPILDQYKRRRLHKLQTRLKKFFEGHALAFERLGEGSSLAYAHLSPGSAPVERITLVDAQQRMHQIATHDLVFVVQRKGEPLDQRLHALLSSRQYQEADKQIDAVLEMIRHELSLGLYDSDRPLLPNLGFIDDHPFHLDVGRLCNEPRYQAAATAEQHLAWVREQIDHWIQERFPEACSLLKASHAPPCE